MQVFIQTLVNGLVTGCLYALIALGYTMVYGVLKLLNFAHGDVYMVGAFIGYFVIQWFGGPTTSHPGAAADPDHVRCSPALGMRRPRRRDRAVRLPAAARRPRIAPLITALGVSFVLENSVLLLFGGFARSYNTTDFISFTNGIHIDGVHIDIVEIMIVVARAWLMMLGLYCSSTGRCSASRCARWRPIARPPRCSASTSTGRSR